MRGSNYKSGILNFHGNVSRDPSQSDFPPRNRPYLFALIQWRGVIHTVERCHTYTSAADFTIRNYFIGKSTLLPSELVLK